MFSRLPWALQFNRLLSENVKERYLFELFAPALRGHDRNLEVTGNMADDGKHSFGLPENWDKIPEHERKQLQKPLIFPNNEKLFKRFTFGVTLGKVKLWIIEIVIVYITYKM